MIGKVILIMILGVLFLTACDGVNPPKHTEVTDPNFKEIKVKEIEVKPIEVKEIQVEKILTEEILTEEIITENIITYDDVSTYWD